MSFLITEEQLQIKESIEEICEQFDEEYWLQRDSSGEFPHELHKAMAEGGWLGIAMEPNYGGAGLGITEAAIMMQAISASGAGMSGASAIHMNIFGLNPVQVFANEEQKQRFLPPLIAGDEKACFAVTEPNAGLDTTSLKTFAKKVDGGYILNGQKIWISTAQQAHRMLIIARTTPKEDVKKSTDGLSLFYTKLDRNYVEVQRIEKMGRKCVDSNMLFIDNLFVPDEDLIGEEGKGFSYLLHGLNPERILIAAEAFSKKTYSLAFGSNFSFNLFIRYRKVFSWIFSFLAMSLVLPWFETNAIRVPNKSFDDSDASNKSGCKYFFI